MNLSSRNRYLLYLLLVILGTTLLFINSKYILHSPGLLLLSVILITLPVILIIFSKIENKNIKLICLILVFLPLILFNYIYYIQIDLPVGFQDVHDHIYQYEHLFNNGTILFSKAQSISYNSVGLYVLYKFMEVVSHTDIIWLVSVIPQFINILITLLVFLFINRLFSFKYALIATMIYGWNDTVLLFGHEFRPQTIGILLLFEVLLVIAIFYVNKEAKSYRKTIIILFLFGGLAIASFVSWVFALIIFISILIASLIFERKKDILIAPSHMIIFCLFFASYIIFIGISLESTATTIINLLKTSFTNELSSPQLGQVIYGNFITWFMYCFWGIFVIGSIYYLKEILLNKLDILKTAFFISFSTLFLLGFILSTMSGTLNTARVYVVTMILIGMIIAFSIFKLLSAIKTQRNKVFIKFFSTFFIILIISTSLAKFPNYIIGNTQPIRETTEIDKYNYWRHEKSIDAASIFMKSAVHNKSLHLHMLIKNYLFLGLYDQNFKPKIESYDNKGHLLYNYIKVNDLILLEDKTLNQSYVNRNSLPPLISYKNFDTVYTNGDYILFTV
jgi:hypothetical protein